MSYRIIYTKKPHPASEHDLLKNIRNSSVNMSKTLKLLELDPFHPSLRLHKLKGRLSEFHAVSINIGYRISIEFLLNEKTIIPVNVGSHEEVYDKGSG